MEIRMEHPRAAEYCSRKGSVVMVLLSILLLLSDAAKAQAVVDINQLDAEVLAHSLPGIGPVKARRIVEYRKRHGPFSRIEDLVSIKGIGPATIARIRTHLEQGGVTPKENSPGREGDVLDTRQALSSSEHERAARRAVRQLVEEVMRDASIPLQ